MKINRSLYSRLALYFITISLTTILITGGIANFGTGIMFKKYLMEKQDKRDKLILEILENPDMNAADFAKEELNKVEMYAMMDGLRITIKDLKNRIIWKKDFIGHDEQMKNLANLSFYDSKKGIVKNTFAISRNNVELGHVEIEFDGKYLFSSSDINFINSFNKWIIVAGLISTIMAFLISVLVSKKIAILIIRVTEAAHSIKNGEFEKRLDVSNHIKEVEELSLTINYLAEELEMQGKLRKQLTSDLAHELRTPITTLQCHTEAILDGIWEPTQERIKSINEEIIRISNLINDIDKLNNIENSMDKLNRTDFDLNELINNIVINFESQVKKRNVSIEFENIDKVPMNADRDKISQIIINLLSNAIKYSKNNGCIWIKIKQADKLVTIYVKDDGIGIEKKYLPFIFERLYRADSSRTRKTGGAGIGLAIVKSIVKAHDGEISVFSEKDLGTEFIVKIPNNKRDSAS